MRTQMNMELQQQFVQQLVERLRNECFSRCISTPGRELSSKDQTCLSNCVDRYLGTLFTITPVRMYFDARLCALAEGMKVVEQSISEHSQSQ